MQSGAFKVISHPTSWLLEYLRSVSLQRFTASAAKRVAVTSTEYVLVSLLVPSALSSSVMFLMTSTAGTMSKGAVCYGFEKLSQGAGGQVMIAIPKEDLEMVQAKLQEDSGWQFSISSIPRKLKAGIKSKATGICHTVLNITYQDLSQGTGAFLGSTIASAAFVVFMGPPSLFILPLYFLAEGCTKSIGAFLGAYGGKYFIGPKIFKPAILSTWHAIVSKDEKQIEAAYWATLYELEKVSFEDEGIEECTELLTSWYLFKEKPMEEPEVKVLDKVTILEEYDGKSCRDYSI